MVKIAPRLQSAILGIRLEFQISTNVFHKITTRIQNRNSLKWILRKYSLVFPAFIPCFCRLVKNVREKSHNDFLNVPTGYSIGVYQRKTSVNFLIDAKILIKQSLTDNKKNGNPFDCKTNTFPVAWNR